MAKEPVHPLHKKRTVQPAAKSAAGAIVRKKKTSKKAAPASAATAPPKRKAKRKSAKRPAGPPAGKVRIQKMLAEAGVASRRACEEMVADARVRVNRKLVTELPCFVDPDADKVTVDGRSIHRSTEPKMYVLLNKPKGVVCTNSDPSGRTRAIDMVSEIPRRLFCVGRLDADSTGVIVLTDDGEFANRISHPRYGLAKTYVVEVDGFVKGDAIETLKAGMYIDGKRTSGAAVRVIKRSKTHTLLEIRLTEGRNREIRRMLARLGYKVRSLRRTAIGPITDRGIKTGKHRVLTDKEVKALRSQTAAVK